VISWIEWKISEVTSKGVERPSLAGGEEANPRTWGVRQSPVDARHRRRRGGRPRIVVQSCSRAERAPCCLFAALPDLPRSWLGSELPSPARPQLRWPRSTNKHDVTDGLPRWYDHLCQVPVMFPPCYHSPCQVISPAVATANPSSPLNSEF